MKATDKLSCLIGVLLDAAEGGGMTKKRAKAIYEDIMSHCGNMKEGSASALLDQVANVLVLDIPDDAWIIAHAEELKAELLELARAGADRPASGTVLGRALEMFTEKERGSHDK